MGGICESPKFKMATAGQFDYCILNGLANISALDVVCGVTLRKEFLMLIVAWPPLAILNMRMRRGQVGHCAPPQKKKKKKKKKLCQCI